MPLSVSFLASMDFVDAYFFDVLTYTTITQVSVVAVPAAASTDNWRQFLRLPRGKGKHWDISPKTVIDHMVYKCTILL